MTHLQSLNLSPNASKFDSQELEIDFSWFLDLDFSFLNDLEKESQGSLLDFSNQGTTINNSSMAPQTVVNPQDELAKKVIYLAQRRNLDWKKVSRDLPGLGLTYKMCREIYNRNAARFVKKGKKFSLKEDLLLIKYHTQLGCNWIEIAGKLEGRDRNMVKNRFYYINNHPNIHATLDFMVPVIDRVQTIDEITDDDLKIFNSSLPKPKKSKSGRKTSKSSRHKVPSDEEGIREEETIKTEHFNELKLQCGEAFLCNVGNILKQL